MDVLNVISGVWQMFFGFFPSWFQSVLGAALVSYLAMLALKAVKGILSIFF